MGEIVPIYKKQALHLCWLMACFFRWYRWYHHSPIKSTVDFVVLSLTF